MLCDTTFIFHNTPKCEINTYVINYYLPVLLKCKSTAAYGADCLVLGTTITPAPSALQPVGTEVSVEEMK